MKKIDYKFQIQDKIFKTIYKTWYRIKARGVLKE